MDNVMPHPMPITYSRPEHQRHAIQFTKNNVGALIQALIHLDIVETLGLGEEASDAGFGRRERVVKPCLSVELRDSFFEQFPHRANTYEENEFSIFEGEFLVLLGAGDFLVMSEQEFNSTYKWGQDEPAKLAPCATPAQDDLAAIAGDREFSEPRVAALEPEVAIAVEEALEDIAEPIAEPEEYGIEERDESPRAKRMAKRNRRD